MRHVLSAVLLALAAVHAPVVHAEPQVVTKTEDPVSEREAARSIELGGLVFPVFGEDRKLKNYLFVNARMLVAPGKDPWKYREQGHFIRDAVLRAAHRTSFHVEGDMTRLDETRAEALSVNAANAALGEGDVLVSMTFTQIASQNNIR